MEKASLQISEFLVKCKESKVNPWDLKSCSKLLQKQNYLRKDKFILAVIALSSLVYLTSFFFPHSTRIDQYQDLIVLNTKCSVGLPDTLRKAFRPPLSCDFCRSVTNVQKVKRITREEFEERFAYTAIPVVIADATANWTALSTFDYWYFKETYNRAKQKQRTLNCQFFPYKSGFRNLYDALENPPENFNLEKKAWYFGWSNCNPEIAEELRQHYGRPYFLPEVSENNAVDWIFMGMSGLGAHMHVDNVRLPSWQAQLSGSKKWVLMPPPECYFVCRQVEVVVDEGDINTNKWYHQTIVLPGRISITIGAEYD